jgi:hypothetical protein
LHGHYVFRTVLVLVLNSNSMEGRYRKMKQQARPVNASFLLFMPHMMLHALAQVVELFWLLLFLDILFVGSSTIIAFYLHKWMMQSYFAPACILLLPVIVHGQLDIQSQLTHYMVSRLALDILALLFSAGPSHAFIGAVQTAQPASLSMRAAPCTLFFLFVRNSCGPDHDMVGSGWKRCMLCLMWVMVILVTCMASGQHCHNTLHLQVEGVKEPSL